MGGIPAVAYSWPAQVMVIVNYAGKYDFGSHVGLREVRTEFMCGGTLISPKVVMTAGHCASIQGFNYKLNDVDYTIPIKFNALYPTLESMFTVYAGIYDIKFLQNKNEKPSPPGVKLTVSQVIVVNPKAGA